MKYIFAVLALLIAASASAHDHRHRGHGRGHGYYGAPNYNWVAPAIVSGIIGYGIARNVAPTIVQPYAVVPQVEVPVPPYGFHWVTVLDAGCNCYRTVLVQN